MILTVESRIERSPRVEQIRGMFDLPEQGFTRLTWDVNLPLAERPWHVGLITGPSGSGKSTLARHLFADALAAADACWGRLSPTAAVVDAFPADLPTREVAALLSAVGFASPPAWLRPFPALSTGQQFRARLALLLAERLPLAVMDEYTSVIDRTVARVGSAALARTVRQRHQRFVAVTCHDDVTDWLQPDWVLTVHGPGGPAFAWRAVRPRPPVELDLFRCTARAWPIFAPHHYLSRALNRSAVCFLAVTAETRRPVAFSAWLNHLSARGGKREHRTVVLPDYQGIGVGSAVASAVASMWKALGHRATSTTTHPAFIAARKRSPHWRMVRAPSLAAGREGRGRPRHATTRLTAGFEYVGPPMNFVSATRLLHR